MTTVVGEDGRIHFGGTWNSHLFQLQTEFRLGEEDRAAEEEDSLRIRCRSREPVCGRLDMMLILSPRSQRSLRLKSGLLALTGCLIPEERLVLRAVAMDAVL